MPAVLFLLFAISGFCGLVYQVVWVRLAFAAFGVITPVLSVVISVFMLGLSVGSWASGKWILPLTKKTRVSAVWYYGVVESLIGIGGVTVPHIFSLGQQALLPLGAMDAGRYLLYSALILGVSILPWCVCMGATFPFMMAFIRERDRRSTTSFSYLYLGNVIGAMCGVGSSVLLIEWIGFRSTLLVAAACNFFITAVSFVLGSLNPWQPAMATPVEPKALDQLDSVRLDASRGFVSWVLFATGFVSMAMEVVWTRAFTPVLRTTIYSFASLLGTYLLATWAGCLLYRRHAARRTPLGVTSLLAFLAVTAFLPILANDPRWHAPLLAKAAALLVSITPFCGTLGYLTPMLIDKYSAGSPQTAGYAYAVNVIGCILGPLFASYVLLPATGVKQSLVFLALPLSAFLAWRMMAARVSLARPAVALGLVAAMAFGSMRFLTSYEDTVFYRNAVARRDHVATVIAEGEGLHKQLYVNGISMTALTPITKIMAHVPLSALREKPEAALIICLGMGTTFRSASRWDIDTTAIELVPSVRDVFGYYFADSAEVLAKPGVRIVIDDGRRYLRRIEKKFDLVAIDPPPPVEAAGSSLLYSEEFYQLLLQRLNDGGILAQWFPGGEKTTLQAVARALHSVFPYVRVFHSIEDWGFHFFASTRPIEIPSSAQFVAKVPEAAQADLVEWAANKDVRVFYEEIIRREVPLKDILPPAVDVSVTDDTPYNEYFLVRRSWNKLRRRHESAH